MNDSTRNQLIYPLLIALSACGPIPEGHDREIASEARGLSGADTQPVTGGIFDAIGTIGPNSNRFVCTATLITDEAVLTAAHCVCETWDGVRTCWDRATFQAHDVYTHANPTQRTHVMLEGQVFVHPQYVDDGYHPKDFAIIRLDHPASDVLKGVQPLRVEQNLPNVGDTVTLVGFGGGNSINERRKGVTQIEMVNAEYSQTRDEGVYVIFGDSGGPMLSAQNRVVGVSSTAFYDDFISQYDNTSLAWNWLKTIACPTFDPTRDMVNFCSDPMCPCGSDEGDCDNDAQCSGSLTCHHDVGNLVGLPASLDVCAPACPAFDPSQPDAAFCSDPYCPCTVGQGDCDGNSQCKGSLICGTNNGPAFGLPDGWEACVQNTGCGNLNLESYEQCDDGDRTSGDGCSATCAIEPGWYCPEFFRCYRLPTPPPGGDPK